MKQITLSDIKSENEIIADAISKGTKIKVRLPSGAFETARIYGNELEFPVVQTESGVKAEFCRATLYSILCGFTAFGRF